MRTVLQLRRLAATVMLGSCASCAAAPVASQPAPAPILVAAKVPDAAPLQKPPEKLSLDEVRVEAVAVNPNLIPNGGFEDVAADGAPAGWQWDERNADASFDVSSDVAYSGARSLHFTNGLLVGANIYATLWQTEPIHLEAGQPYTLSAAVKSEGGGGNLLAGKNWNFRLPLPATEGQWRRVSMTFTPGPDDGNYQPRLGIDATTAGTWVDDLKLEKGKIATPSPGQQPRLQLDPNPAEAQIQGDGKFEMPFLVLLPQAPSAPLAATFTASFDNPKQTIEKRVTLTQAVSRLVLSGQSSGLADAPRALRATLTLENAQPLQTSARARFYSQAVIAQRVDALRRRLPNLEKQIQTLRAAGQDVSYPLVPLTVLQNFPAYIEQDAAHETDGQRDFLTRAARQLDELEPMAARLEADLSGHQKAGAAPYPVVPRWTGQTRPRVQGPSLLGAATSGAKTEERPLFFNGFGHFQPVVNDLEKWPAYGTNIIMIDVGPNRVFPAPDKVDEAPIAQTKAILQRASKAGVAVSLLISPHYMPAWMLQAHPELKKKRLGFLQYSLYDPASKELLQRFIATLIPPLKDEPALQSICLSNEPINVEAPGPLQLRDWHDWLQKRHGTINQLNARWKTSYADFGAVPLPNAFNLKPVSAAVADYIRFNQQWFADWHAMLADAVHAVAPDLPVQAKAQVGAFYHDWGARFGLDAYLMGQISDINGNDSRNEWNYNKGDFAQNFADQTLGYDLQRSVRDAPVYNSENHLITDRDTRAVPPAHIRAALWQGAVHGQSASTIWVWARTFNPASGFYGSIMERPQCAAAVGLVNYDLNRAAVEVTALQSAPPQTMILQSVSAATWDGAAYDDCLVKLYTALAFTGAKTGFIEEYQLENGVVPSAPVVLVPNVSHLSRAAIATLQKYRGRLVFVGAQGFARDEYDQPQQTDLRGEQIPFTYAKTGWKALWQAANGRLAAWKIAPEIQVTDAQGKAVWGVEWRVARAPNGTVLNLCNYRQTPLDLTLTRDGKAFAGRDVLSGATVGQKLTLQPLETRLITLGE